MVYGYVIIINGNHMLLMIKYLLTKIINLYLLIIKVIYYIL